MKSLNYSLVSMSTTIVNKIDATRKKEYYVKVLGQLKLLGLQDLVEDLFNEQTPLNYVILSIRIISFLQENRKVFSNFTQNTFEKILLLSIDEVVKAHNLEIKPEELELIMQLLGNTFLIRKFSLYFKDVLMKVYYSVKNAKCCKSKSVDVVEIQTHAIVITGDTV